MSDFKFGDSIFWLSRCESEQATYINWISIYEGKVVWVSPDQQILHAYREGIEEITVLLDIPNFVFKSKEQAKEMIIKTIQEDF